LADIKFNAEVLYIGRHKV